AKEIQSAFIVLERSVSLVIAETEIRGMAGADLIVRVNLEDYTTTDYEKADALVQRGYDAAAAKALILKTYALSDPDWAEYQRQIQSRRRTTIGTPQFVRVEGTSPENDKNIQNFLRLFVGKPISTPSLDEYLTRLTGLGRFDSVTYGMVRENGQDGLLVRVHEKTYAPPLLQPSFSLDGSEPMTSPSPWALASPSWMLPESAPNGALICSLAPPMASQRSFTGRSCRPAT